MHDALDLVRDYVALGMPTWVCRAAIIAAVRQGATYTQIEGAIDAGMVLRLRGLC